MLVSSENRFQCLDPIRQAGVVAILPKPFSREALNRALTSSLDFVHHLPPVSCKKPVDKLSVLLVDDSRLARKHMQKVLLKVGINDQQLIQAEDGAEAIELLTHQHFDLVLTDYNMPEVDGEQLLKFIRQQDRLKQLPVIMVTSEQNQSKLASIQNNGVTAMMDKPFEPPHLRQLLETHVG